jgi:hypothetical protein
MYMKILKRNTNATRRADEHLTYFTTSEANEFRALVRTSFAEVGRDVSVYSDHVDDRTGTTFGLWNIGALCAGVERGDWPELIGDHVRRVTTPTRDLDDLTREEFEAAVYLRIVEAASVAEPDHLGYARVLAPGLLEVISVDLPDSVATPSKEDLAARGTLHEIMERGRTNLRALLTAEDVHSETVDGASGGRITAVTGDSFFIASLALLLPEAVERFSGGRDLGRGVLFALPSRHRLLYRVIDGPDAVSALHAMFQSARDGFRTEPGPLSPNVYWVRNHKWVQATSVADGRPQVFFGSGLGDALR